MKKPLRTFDVQHLTGEIVRIKATDEAEARQLAMIKRWGLQPDLVTPDAPDYKGRGLSVTEVAS